MIAKSKTASLEMRLRSDGLQFEIEEFVLKVFRDAVGDVEGITGIMGLEQLHATSSCIWPWFDGAFRVWPTNLSPFNVARRNLAAVSCRFDRNDSWTAMPPVKS
jgi:hypothetical protein